MSWFDQLQPASFRGVPFGVLGSEGSFGRRQAVHEYPMKDKAFPEDMGRQTRRFVIRGFLVENSLVYGGGSVFDQRDRMVKAIETAEAGTLVHPSLGRMKVSGTLTTNEKADEGRYIELVFSFVEDGARLFPNTAGATGGATVDAANGLDTAASSDFVSRAVADLKYGASVVNQVVSTATKWATPALAIVRDATNLSHLASVLPGEFGRYFGGGNVGGLGASTNQLFDTVTSVSDLIVAGARARALVDTAVNTVLSVATTNDPPGLATAGQSLAEALRAACADPADALRLIAQMAVSPIADPVTSSPVGLAMADIQTGCNDVFRRAAVAAMARASSVYQPSSYDDAIRIRNFVTNALDAEALVAGDQGEDGSYQALRTLRKAVINDLTQRGANLAIMTTFTFRSTLPSLYLANRIYLDASREDQLVRQAATIHPLFMPQTFRALAS